MNYTKLFYWLSVADNAKIMFIVFMTLFSSIALIATITYFINIGDEYTSEKKEEEQRRHQKMSRKWMWWSYPLMIIFWSLYIFTPNKKDALLIIAGGQTLNYLTTDSLTAQIPRELSGFVISELKNMAKEAKVELNISNQKDKILEEAKSLSGAELIEKLKTDSLFKNILLK